MRHFLSLSPKASTTHHAREKGHLPEAPVPRTFVHAKVATVIIVCEASITLRVLVLLHSLRAKQSDKASELCLPYTASMPNLSVEPHC
jgi:hypothetical protein